jgi:hypothetical protein
MTVTSHPIPHVQAAVTSPTGDSGDLASDRRIDAAGVDSFPASDPPGWWSGPGPTAHTTDSEEGPEWL